MSTEVAEPTHDQAACAVTKETLGEPISWGAHPVAARALRITALVGPIAVAAATTWLLALGVGRPSGALAIVWWLGMLVFATAVYAIVERGARVLLPLSSLLRLSLRFPEGTPSRFRVAMRSRSTRELRAIVEQAQRGEQPATPGEAAAQVLLLVAALNVHDCATRGHSERVRAYAEVIGREMGLDDSELDELRWAALLHDIGKIAVPARILSKPSRLTAEEFEVIKTHPVAGMTFVEPLRDWLGDGLSAVVQHHERVDGTGYPHRLAADEISLAARIVSVADTLDVITSQRSYKEPMSTKDALAEITRCSGTQFDEDVVRALLSISLGRIWLAGGPLAWVASVPGLASVPAAGVVVTAVGNAGVATLVTATVLGTATILPTLAAASDGETTMAPTTVAAPSTSPTIAPGSQSARGELPEERLTEPEQSSESRSAEGSTNEEVTSDASEEVTNEGTARAAEAIAAGRGEADQLLSGPTRAGLSPLPTPEPPAPPGDLPPSSIPSTIPSVPNEPAPPPATDPASTPPPASTAPPTPESSGRGHDPATATPED